MTTVEDDEEVNPVIEERMARSNGPSAPQTRSTEGKVLLPLRKRRRAAAGMAMQDSLLRFGGGPLSYEPYDFRRPDKLSKEHLRSLQLLHESFANYFSSSLATYLRAQVQLEVVSVEQVPYDEYMRSISASLLYILNVTPLSGQAIFEMDYGILFSMIDRLLGGTGAAGKILRDLTDIEKMLAENIVHYALNDLRNSWEGINPLQFDVASVESSSQFVQIVPGNDTVVLILMEIRMGDYQGAISICLPYLLIKPILGKLSAQRWFISANKKKEPMYGAQLAQRLNSTRVPCIARLGTASLTMGALNDLKVGSVIPIKMPLNEDGSQRDGHIATVDLVVGNRTKFRGRTGLRGRNLAVQIDEIVTPEAELISNKEAN
ncbi:MAG: flagellar motor switch protein FliM [Capsulimonas sp.]|nr:flagellar motor switch protein FliM [Capsulimonas sp.]